MHTLTKPAEHEEVIKRSRFRARAWPVDGEDGIAALLDEVRGEAASHHCWAWRIGDAYRFDDAGEPAGTAGRPIFQALDHHDLDRVLVVVTRWFGGVKLGAGGLVRAYGGVAGRCLEGADRQRLIAYALLTVTAGFAHTGVLHELLDRHGAEKLRETWRDDGVQLTVRLDAGLEATLKSELTDATGGGVGFGRVS